MIRVSTPFSTRSTKMHTLKPQNYIVTVILVHHTRTHRHTHTHTYIYKCIYTLSILTCHFRTSQWHESTILYNSLGVIALLNHIKQGRYKKNVCLPYCTHNYTDTNFQFQTLVPYSLVIKIQYYSRQLLSFFLKYSKKTERPTNTMYIFSPFLGHPHPSCLELESAFCHAAQSEKYIFNNVWRSSTRPNKTLPPFQT